MRTRRWWWFFGLVWVAANLGCTTSPRDSFFNLREFDSDRGAGLQYAESIVERRIWMRFWNALGVGTDEREIEDPVVFAIAQLVELELSELEDFRETEWLSVAELVAKSLRREPSSIVQAQGLRVLDKILAAYGEPVSYRESEVSEADRETIALATEFAADRTRSEPTAAERAQLSVEADAIGQLPTAKIRETDRLVEVASVLAGRWEGDPLGQRYLSAGWRQIARLSYQTAMTAMARQAPGHTAAREVWRRGLELQYAIDPVVTSQWLVEVSEQRSFVAYDFIGEPVLKISFLDMLVQRGIALDALAPELRRRLLFELDSPNIAVADSARGALASLLGLDPETATADDVRPKWTELGGWDSPGEGS